MTCHVCPDHTADLAILRAQLAEARARIATLEAEAIALHQVAISGTKSNLANIGLHEQLAEAREVLRSVEWGAVDPDDFLPTCPACRALKTSSGHAPDCRLAAQIPTEDA